MVTLYTPGTGFPDLEAKIAFGLVRLGSTVGTAVRLVPQPGFYAVEIEGAKLSELKELFRILAGRLLGAESLYALPGVQAAHRKRYPTAEEGKVKAFYMGNDLLDVYLQPTRLVGFEGPVCGHRRFPLFGGAAEGGLILAHSAHAGKLYGRDRVGTRKNKPLCAACGSMAVLGIHAACVQVDLKRRQGPPDQALITPLPSAPMDDQELRQWLAAQKLADGHRLPSELPIHTLALALLAHFPHLAAILGATRAELHVTGFTSDGRGGFRLTGQTVRPTGRLAKFVETSPFNAATVSALVDRRAGGPAIEPLTLLVEFLQTADYARASDLAIRFARSHLAANGYPLHGDTAANLLGQVIKLVHQEEDQVVVQVHHHPAIESVAKTFRHFILRERNYGYIDSLRNVQRLRELQELLVTVVRQAQVRQPHVEAYRQDRISGSRRGGLPHVPREDEVVQVLELAAHDRNHLTVVRGALALRALCWESTIDGIVPDPTPEEEESVEEQQGGTR